jgi:DNA-binding transcriptional ArsR family regulator
MQLRPAPFHECTINDQRITGKYFRCPGTWVNPSASALLVLFITVCQPHDRPVAGSAYFLLTYSHMGMYFGLVPRAAATSDVFNAVAEPRRREILNYLALREHQVGDIAATLRLEQPSVSKHLRVLLETGLVQVRRDGRHMLYRTNAEGIRPLHEWAGQFERFWQHQLIRVKERAEQKYQPGKEKS